MKELLQIWSRVTGRQYSSVNTDRERPRKNDIDISTFEANLSECEELNHKFNDDLDFNERKDAIINRLFTRRRSQQNYSKKPKRLFSLLVLGFLLLGVGISIMLIHPYDIIFQWKQILGDGGEIYEMWRKPDVQLFTRVFLFNVTNAEEYMNGYDTKLKVAEVGPYVYREMLEHSNVTFNENGTLSAIPKHPLVWNDELSEGHKEDDILYLPHIALLSIAHVTSQKNFFTRLGLNQLIKMTNSQPLVKMTAKEFMMGHQSELMALGHSFLPGWIYFDKLGLIDRMYDFEGDYETIFTGETDFAYSGLIDTYRGSTDLPQWEGKHCSNVQNASDGTKFKGDIGKNESILFFRKSLCRAAPLVKIGEGVKGGIKGYEYTFPEHMIDNGKHIEENKCFCRLGNCLPEGLIDVTDCYYGFPIALSYPHFYKGDDILFEKVEGLTPNTKDHETRLWINPESGLPLDISAKIQINMALGDISMIENTKKFSNMYLPMLWFDIRLFSLTPAMETKFGFYLNIFPVVEKVLMYLSIFTAVIMITIATYISTFRIILKTHRDRQYNFKTNIYIEREKANKDIYAPCEIPVSESETENERPFVKTQNRLRELSQKLTGKMQDSVGNVKDKFELSGKSDRKNSLINVDSSESETSEFESKPFMKTQTERLKELSQKITGKMHDFGKDKAKNDRKNSLIADDDGDECNDAYNSGDDYSKDDYLEVIDDGSEFDET